MTGKHLYVIFSFLALCTSILLFSSCTDTKTELAEEESRKTVKKIKRGKLKITLTPSYVTRDGSVTAVVKGARLSDVSYQWIVNDREIKEATGKVFDSPDLKKHDRVQVKVYVRDRGEMTSELLIISNSIPAIQTARLLPENPAAGNELEVEAVTVDGDDDAVSLSYKWSVNNKPIDEHFSLLDLERAGIRSGDKVSVTIIPTDGEHTGRSITLNTFVVNSAPKVARRISETMKGSMYYSRVIADDPDGDTLTYSLVKGPKGMFIDPSSGKITWEVEPEDVGNHDITVSVKDGEGGTATVQYTAEIGMTQKK
jgi:hypothetical protein